MTGYTIENIVASTMVADSLNLDLVAKTFPDSLYNPADTPVVILHKTTPKKAAVMLLSNGTLVCTGLTSVQDVDDLVQSTCKVLRSAGIFINEKPEIKIQTIVAVQELNQKLNLPKIAKKLGTINVEYNPKQFPGLIYKKEYHNTVILLFNTGKMICTGSNLDSISQSFETVTNELSSFGIIELGGKK